MGFLWSKIGGYLVVWDFIPLLVSDKIFLKIVIFSAKGLSKNVLFLEVGRAYLQIEEVTNQKAIRNGR